MEISIILVCGTHQGASFWQPLATVEEQRQQGDVRLTDGPTCSRFSFLSPFNPSVTAMKWWNLSVTLKRREARNALIKAGGSITNSVESRSGRALQSHCVIPAQLTDYSGRECKRDEIETLTLQLMKVDINGGWVFFLFFLFSLLTVWKYLHFTVSVLLSGFRVGRGIMQEDQKQYRESKEVYGWEGDIISL